MNTKVYRIIHIPTQEFCKTGLSTASKSGVKVWGSLGSAHSAITNAVQCSGVNPLDYLVVEYELKEINQHNYIPGRK